MEEADRVLGVVKGVCIYTKEKRQRGRDETTSGQGRAVSGVVAGPVGAGPPLASRDAAWGAC